MPHSATEQTHKKTYGIAHKTMHINKLKLENIRSYVREEISFSAGSTLLSGDIGAGKSTILQAIEFALFGLVGNEIDAQSLLRHGCLKGTIELHCTIDSHKVIIQRTLVQKKDSIVQATGLLTVNGFVQELSAQEMRAQILALAGYAPDTPKNMNLLYRYTVYTNQDSMKHILYDSGRYHTLRAIFRMEQYKQIIENALILKRELRSDASGIEIVQSDIEELEKHIQHHTDESERLKKEEETLKNQKKAFETTLQTLEAELTQLVQVRQRQQLIEKQQALTQLQLDQITQAITQTQQSLTHTQEQIRQKSQLVVQSTTTEDEQNLAKEFSDKKNLQTQLLTTTQQTQKHTKHISEQLATTVQAIQSLQPKDLQYLTLEKEYQELQTQIKKLQTDATLAGELVPQQTQQKQLIEKQITETATTRKNLIEQKNEIEQLTVCPLCRQHVGDDHKESICTALTRKVTTLVAKETVLENELTQITQTLKIQTQILEHLRATSQKLLAMQTQLVEGQLIKNQLVSLNQTKDTLGLQLSELESKLALDSRSLLELSTYIQNNIQEYERIATKRQRELASIHAKQDIHTLTQSLTSCEQTIITLTAQKSQLETKLKELLINSKDLLEHINQLAPKEQGKNQQMRLLQQCEKELVQVQTQLQNETRSIEQNVQALKQKNILLANKQLCTQSMHFCDSIFIPLVNKIERDVFLQIHQQFSALFSQWVRQLLDDTVFDVRLDNQFNPIISQNGYDTHIGALSGGEKTTVSLAYRLALNDLLCHMSSGIKTRDLLILDEPTEGFSFEQLDKIRIVLERVQATQIILVSHEQKLATFVQKTIDIQKTHQGSHIRIRV